MLLLLLRRPAELRLAWRGRWKRTPKLLLLLLRRWVSVLLNILVIHRRGGKPSSLGSVYWWGSLFAMCDRLWSRRRGRVVCHRGIRGWLGI